ncbi:MAG: porin family protein [Flavobacteriales bacterium]|nr:porin family protein [Flavobacteriales bacterium]
MKKLLTFFTVVALTTTVSFAQAQFGATAGLNMANITGGDVDDEWVMKMGMHFGLSANITLSDNMTLNTGALYSTKGSQMEESGVEVAINLSYIEIPLNLSFPVSEQMSLMAGPYIALLMSAEATVKFDASPAADDVIDIKEDTRSMDYGINIGAGFAVTEAFSINAGYQIGLASLDPDGTGVVISDDDDSVKNSNIHIGMTYSFGGGY